MFAWCALDPDSATAYEWPARWNGSVPLPVSGKEPWGIDDRWQPTFAWWRSTANVSVVSSPDGLGDARGKLWNPPTGGPLFFILTTYQPAMDLAHS